MNSAVKGGNEIWFNGHIIFPQNSLGSERGVYGIK